MLDPRASGVRYESTPVPLARVANRMRSGPDQPIREKGDRVDERGYGRAGLWRIRESATWGPRGMSLRHQGLPASGPTGLQLDVRKVRGIVKQWGRFPNGRSESSRTTGGES
jgi:hypothetical protein